ncbi:ABC transporter permease [Ruminococcus gauvreauii]|uniref:ABC transporter permease n=1 Tax=Ruminococcus gauvreauii TaxID=438033 RepID=UPI0039846011
MYVKLALRNVKRSIGDYAIYVLTLTLSITLIFAYNALLFSDAIVSFSQLMRPMMSILVCVTLIVVLILGWLIAYITQFIFEQRSREFACYMTMGMERRTMSRLFLAEQLVIGGAALFIGVLIGNFFYFTLSQVIFRMFDREYYMDLSFQLPAIALTIVCFLLMFFCSLLRQRNILKKIQVKELMSYERKNEAPQKKRNISRSGRLLLDIAVGILGLFSLYLAFTLRVEALGGFGNLALMAAGVILQGIGLMLFYRDLSEGILEQYRKNPKRRLHRLNIFFYRQLTGRLKTNGRQMGVISILLLFTLLGLGGAAFMANSYQRNLARHSPFDVEVAELYGELDTETCRGFIRRRSDVTSEHSYHIYMLRDSELIAETLDKKQPVMEGYENMSEEQNKDRCIRLSDYNKLREMLGRKPLKLNSDEYFVQTDEEYYAEKFRENPGELRTGGKVYRLREIYQEDFAQDMINRSGFGTNTLLVLPDEAVSKIEPYSQCYMAMVRDRDNTDYQQKLTDLLESGNDHDGASFIVTYTYAGQKNELQAIYMMTAFICCYAAFICIFICAAILSVQLLSSSRKYRYQYDQLRRMGTSEREILGLIRRQTAVYFLLPMGLPFFFLILYMAGIGFAFPVYRDMMFGSFIGANGIFLLVYGCYLVITCLQYQKNVLKNTKKYHLRELTER